MFCWFSHMHKKSQKIVRKKVFFNCFRPILTIYSIVGLFITTHWTTHLNKNRKFPKQTFSLFPNYNHSLFSRSKCAINIITIQHIKHKIPLKNPNIENRNFTSQNKRKNNFFLQINFNTRKEKGKRKEKSLKIRCRFSHL